MSTPDDIKGKATTPVPFFRLETIKTRPEFKAANGGARFSTPGFTLLRAPQAGGAGVRFGFTVTKKLGKAVLRNRIRRRLRAAALEALRRSGATLEMPAMDLVVLARSAAALLPYPALCEDMARAVTILSRKAAGAKKGTETDAKAKAALGKDGPLA